jgi:hypothetical protein
MQQVLWQVLVWGVPEVIHNDDDAVDADADG